MIRVFLDLAVSLDGFMSGPDGGDGGPHDWYFAPDAADVIKVELLSRIGAIILGRAAFGTAPDGFDAEYHVPHFILTHHALPSVQRGGADVAGQILAAGLPDEMQVHVAPVLLGGGPRLFTDAPPSRLEPVRTVPSAHATHLTYRFTKAPHA